MESLLFFFMDNSGIRLQNYCQRLDKFRLAISQRCKENLLLSKLFWNIHLMFVERIGLDKVAIRKNKSLK
jgi:hypothetical protein